GIDGGGVLREFLTDPSREVFDSDRGLWIANKKNELEEGHSMQGSRHNIRHPRSQQRHGRLGTSFTRTGLSSLQTLLSAAVRLVARRMQLRLPTPHPAPFMLALVIIFLYRGFLKSAVSIPCFSLDRRSCVHKVSKDGVYSARQGFDHVRE
ncbi:hypothetical protein BJY52DRAFT_1114332, partial [Lactarius psammicola]